uniref:RNA exonuclease 5 isoform X1 n=1 Tax=Pogona vitticeps TaxID=103695 RepID=A0ABM5EZR7_9SAUR
MATATQVMKNKRKHEGNENGETLQKMNKKRKISQGNGCQKEQNVAVLSKEKKPRLSVATFGKGCEIDYDQLFEFLKYSALGKQCGATQPSWCRIHHRRHLAGVVVVVLHEVGQLHFYQSYLQFKHLRKTFRHRFLLPPLSNDFMEKLSGARMKGNCQITSQEVEKNPIVEKYGEECQGLSRYLLTPEEMCSYDYPLEGCENCSHFVPTCCNSPATDKSPLFGLDCEMCLTDKGSELTRISVVDSSGQCVMDELVKPKLPIRNYLTSYSGITEKLLLPVTITLADIQARLRDLLPADAVLVGHSLNFDLRALEMVHPHVIDTSLLFARKGGRRFKLKFLAEAVLGKEIQHDDGAGHNPTEDARSALELAQYFIDKGPRKVAELNLETQLVGQRQAGKGKNGVLPTQKNRVQKRTGGPIQSLLDILHSMDQKTLLLGEESETASYDSQHQVLQRALEEVPRSSFSVVQFALDSRHVTSTLTAAGGSKMRRKLDSMLTVYAGPFGKDVCLKSVKRAFKRYGHIRSIRIIPETFKPHICVQYEVLEAAQLAVDHLNGAKIGGSRIKVQRPITEITLDGERLVKELEKDAENKTIIYLAGVGKTQNEADLQEELGYLKDLCSVFLPRDPGTGRQRNYCFLKFQTAKSATEALAALEEQTAQGSKLQSRQAITLPYLHQWTSSVNQNGTLLAAAPSHLHSPLQEEVLKKAMKAFDCRIRKLYQRLPNHTLCVVLLPGKDRLSESIPGFGLLGIKGENQLAISS